MGVEYRFTGNNHRLDLLTALAWVNNLKLQVAPESSRHCPNFVAVMTDVKRLRRQLPLISLAVEAEGDEDDRQQMKVRLEEVESTAAQVWAAVELERALTTASSIVVELRRTKALSQTAIKSWWLQVDFWLRVVETYRANPELCHGDNRKRLKLAKRGLECWHHNLRSQYQGRLEYSSQMPRPTINLATIDTQISQAFELIK